MTLRIWHVLAGVALTSWLGVTCSVEATPIIWEPNFGPSLNLDDDDSANVVLPFNFPFYGTNYTSVEVGSNGVLSFPSGSGSGPLDGDPAFLLNGPPKIDLPNFDQDPSSDGAVRANVLADRAVFTWDGVPEFASDLPNTFQVQIFDSGQIILGYDVLHPMPTDHRHHGIVGVSPGGGASDPGEVDFTALPPVHNTGAEPTIYEFFARGPNGATGPDPDPFDLATPMRNIIFTPNGQNGFIVEQLIVPEPSCLLLVAAGLLSAGLRRQPRLRRTH
jgi:hypothetical protein